MRAAIVVMALVVPALVGGCGAGASEVAAGPGGSLGTTGAASCAAQQFAAARTVVEGTMLPGPAVGPQSQLSSPARMRVDRYLKGHGPSVVAVETAVARRAGGIVGNAEGIDALAWQRWRIFSQSARAPLATSICAGSVVVGGGSRG